MPYRERVQPSAPLLALAALAGASFGLILVPLSVPVAAVVSTLLALTSVAFALVASPLLEADAAGFRAGPARIEGEFLGAVETLDKEAIRRAMGVDADARAYLCHRGYAGGAVKVTIDDPRDPTPYWLVSSNRPDSLAQALRALTATV